jgi:hypothetical protein
MRMNNKVNNGGSFVSNRNVRRLLQDVLLPMSDVVFTEDNGGDISLKKDGIQFGIIKGGVLLLLHKSSEYYQLKKAELLNRDGLLYKATRSFWVASGKIDPIQSDKHSQ